MNSFAHAMKETTSFYGFLPGTPIKQDVIYPTKPLRLGPLVLF